MAKKIILAITIFFFGANSLCFGICKEDWGPDFNEIIDSINWHCFFPIRFAGVKVDPYKNTDKNDLDESQISQVFEDFQKKWKTAPPSPAATSTPKGVFCQCKGGVLSTLTGGTLQIGIKVSFWEPVRVIEVTKDAWCFPFLFSTDMGDDDNIGNTPVEKLKRNNDGSRSVGPPEIPDETHFWQVHYYVFPVMAVLELLTDFICADMSPFDLAYFTEVDPSWNDSTLSAILTPEAVLFANPVSVMACAAEAMSASLKMPIDLMYWCQGGWDTVFPLTGYVTGSFKESEAAAMGRMLFKLHRELVLWGTIGKDALCHRYPMPIWRKSQYKFQLMWPVRDHKCRVIGEPGLLWTANKNPPVPKKNMDNFVNLLWRKRDCCAR